MLQILALEFFNKIIAFAQEQIVDIQSASRHGLIIALPLCYDHVRAV